MAWRTATRWYICIHNETYITAYDAAQRDPKQEDNKMKSLTPKRVLSIVLTLALTLSLLPVGAFAATDGRGLDVRLLDG